MKVLSVMGVTAVPLMLMVVLFALWAVGNVTVTEAFPVFVME